VSKQLVKPAERKTVFAEFVLEGLLRADSAGRAALYSTFAQNGITTRNEIRGRENMPPKDGGDALTVQSNLVPLDQLGAVGSADQQARSAVASWLGIDQLAAQLAAATASKRNDDNNGGAPAAPVE